MVKMCESIRKSSAKSIYAREILDSRGFPTVEVEIETDGFMVRTSVPSGSSVGLYEAVELRDKTKDFLGKGVKKAVSNVNDIIAKKISTDFSDLSKQSAIDKAMIDLDGTENKSKLGANSILPVSVSCAKATAMASKIQLFQYIASIYDEKVFSSNSYSLPIPMMNVLNGGKHAGNQLGIQEFMIVPLGASSFYEAVLICSEVYSILKGKIVEKFGLDQTSIGDEGGFAPNLKTADEALDLITSAISSSRHVGKVKIALDCAASEFYVDNKYDLGFKIPQSDPMKPKPLTSDQLIEEYSRLVQKYPIFSIEDPFDQDDYESWAKFTEKFGSKIQIVGDDLLVTNPKRISIAIEKRLCNSLLLKLNQIGTITESLNAAKLAKSAGFNVIVSHRSGETEDTTIADFAVGISSAFIKSGAPARSERTAKYNQLLRIEEQLVKLKETSLQSSPENKTPFSNEVFKFSSASI